LKEAYQNLQASKPDLPEPGSPVPAILAAKVLRQTIAHSRAGIDAAQSQLESAKFQSQQEASSLADAKLLSRALESRISRLEAAGAQRDALSPEDAVHQLITKKRHQQKHLQLETKRLSKALDDFVADHLGAMLAAEELGGPVAGEADIDDDMLVAGFSSHGRPRTVKSSSNDKTEASRQMRIDQIWGPSSREVPASTSEAEAASQELNTLLNDLIDASTGNAQNGVYLPLNRDSAAARFLVRAKVAQFHPRDARRLRLVDFARLLDQ
jgi:hypothetical protein